MTTKIIPSPEIAYRVCHTQLAMAETCKAVDPGWDLHMCRQKGDYALAKQRVHGKRELRDAGPRFPCEE